MLVEGKNTGRQKKNDSRDIRNWCEFLSFNATTEGDQYLLAALYRISVSQSKDTKDIRDRISEVARQCQIDHISRATKKTKRAAKK